MFSQQGSMSVSAFLAKAMDHPACLRDALTHFTGIGLYYCWLFSIVICSCGLDRVEQV